MAIMTEWIPVTERLPKNNEFKMETKMNKIEKHAKICQELTDMYEKKNADYGDSFAELRKEFPNSITLRLTDKLNRLKTLYDPKYKQKVSDESIDDTLKDIANYAILELIERQGVENIDEDKPFTLIIDKRSEDGILICKYIDEFQKTLEIHYLLAFSMIFDGNFMNANFILSEKIYDFLKYICSIKYVDDYYCDITLGQSALAVAFEMMEENRDYAKFEASDLGSLKRIM